MIGNLFVALRFDDATVDALCRYRDEVLSVAPRTPMVRSGNWHVTLAFLGQDSRERLAREVLESYQGRPFELLIGGFGTFGRGSHQTLWAGVEASPALRRCHRDLVERLAEAGFELPERAFTPHITLSRRWGAVRGVDLAWLRERVLPIEMPVRALSLLRTVRDGQAVRYEEVGRAELATPGREDRSSECKTCDGWDLD